LNISAK